MQNAQHLIDIVAIDGQASVLTRRNRPPDRLIIVVEIDAYDFIVRHHDVIDRHFLEIQDAEQHRAIAAGYARTGLEDDGAQFLARQ